VDVRIVAAANVDLSLMADQGLFKQDLLDRLSFEVIYVPPLRYRKGDIRILAEHFAGRMAFELGWDQVPELSPSAVDALESHDWPGNVRELKNVVERAVYKSLDHRISNISFDPFVSPYGRLSESKKPAPDPAHRPGEDESTAPLASEIDFPVQDLAEKPLKDAVSILERHRLTQALANALFNQKKAARILGLSYDQFRGLKKKHCL